MILIVTKVSYPLEILHQYQHLKLPVYSDKIILRQCSLTEVPSAILVL